MSGPFQEMREFVSAARRNPKAVSTVFPTLKILAQEMVLAAGVNQNSMVVELGAGTGPITQAILSESPQSYVGVELDQTLVNYLRERFPGSSFLCASATDLKPHIADESQDAVISSLPWTILDEETQQAINNEVQRILKPGGVFVTFICLNSMLYPGAFRARRLFAKTYRDFESQKLVFQNIPPARIFVGRK